jgi:YD repeat-containing protein
VSSSGRLGYRYDGSWVKAVTFQAGTSGDKQAEEAVVRRFEYDAQGQLLAELDAAGARTEYRVTSDLRGNQIEAVSPGAGSQNDSVRYDAAYRPVEARYADGTLVTWEHPEGGDVVAEVTNPDGGKIRLTESADHRRRTLGLADNSKITGEYDTAGRLTSLAENGRVLLRQEWSGDGRLLTAGNETCAEHVEYDADGLMSRVLFAPPQEHGHFSHWQEMKLDSAGRPREISDYTGLQVLVDYDESGEPKAMACKREGKNYGFQITRDASGRIQEVESSWGKQHYTYDASGSLEKMNIEKQGRSASVQYQSGLLRRYTQFDGGEMRVDYYEEPARQGFPREIRTSNDLRLTYDYDPQSRLSKVEVGSTYRMEFAYDVQGRLCSLRQSPVTR